MSFLKSRLLPLPLSLLCPPPLEAVALFSSGIICLPRWIHTAAAAVLLPSSGGHPRYFYDIFSTLYRYFPPRPGISKPTPFFFRYTSKRFNVLFYIYIYYYYCYYYYIFIINFIFVYSAPSSTAALEGLLFFSPIGLHFISIPFVR